MAIMVQTFATNAQNDLFVNSAGSLTMLTGIQAVAQACRSACLTQLGECVLQTGYGLPNFQTVWVGTPNLAIWESYLQTTLLNVDGVTSVQSINITAANNTLTFVAEINTIYGSTTING